MKEGTRARWGQRRGSGPFLLQTQRPSFVRMEMKKKSEAELSGFEGLQM